MLFLEKVYSNNDKFKKNGELFGLKRGNKKLGYIKVEKYERINKETEAKC